MRWIDKGTASFLVENGYIVGTVSMMEDRTWAWSAWGEGDGASPLGRGRADSKLSAQAAVKAVLG